MLERENSLILLDTHIWLWLAAGNERISTTKFQTWIDPFRRQSLVRISVISIWEVALLHSKGRIQLDKPVHDWIHDALNVSELLVAPFTPDIAIESCQFSSDFHGDPADRIIVATAKSLNAELVTMDRKIIEYAKKTNLRIHSFE